MTTYIQVKKSAIEEMLCTSQKQQGSEFDQGCIFVLLQILNFGKEVEILTEKDKSKPVVKPGIRLTIDGHDMGPVVSGTINMRGIGS